MAAAVPKDLRHLRSLDFTDDRRYQERLRELLFHLHGEPLHHPAPLGEVPDFAAWRQELGREEQAAILRNPLQWATRPPEFYEGWDDPAPTPADQLSRYGEYWVIGADPPWYGRVREGSYRLSNIGVSGAVRYMHFSMTDAQNKPLDLREAPVTTRLRIASEPRSPATGAGLLCRFDRQRRTYLAFFVLANGQVAEARNTGEGLAFRGPWPGPRIPPGDFCRVAIRAGEGRLQFFVEDEPVITCAAPELTGSEVGLIAADVGEFEFDDFAIYSPGERTPA
jgi:hypothetical protein